MAENYDWVAFVREFQEKFEKPKENMAELIRHRMMLIEEEFLELREAAEKVAKMYERGNIRTDDFAQQNLEIIDGLGDLCVVEIGMANLLGMDINEAMHRIYESNMSKLGADGKPMYYASGKVAKGPNYFKPKLDGLVDHEKGRAFAEKLRNK